jgi:outer membrane protein assembly factor BamB
MSRLFSFGLAAAALAALAASAASTDWPQFRGAKRDDISPDKGLLKSWPKAGPKLLWKGPGVGEGFSSVAVVGERVFTMGDKNRAAHVFALSRSTGKLLWSRKIGEAGGNYSGTRCTPTVDGNLLYAIGQFGDLVCLETATGAVKWRKNFARDFAGSSGGWNYTESPLIDGDRLVCTPGGSKATMVALDKKTGAEVWRAPLEQTAGYSSVVVSHGGGVKHYVQLTDAGTIGVRAKDGKLLWAYEKFSGNTANIPTPIVLGDQVFTCAGYGRGGSLLTLRPDGAGVKCTEKYHSRNLANKHGGVVIVGDYVYGDTDDSGNPFCAEWKTGKVRWTRRGSKHQGKGGGSAAVTWADGMLYIRYSDGWVSLVPAGQGGYAEKGSFKVPNGTHNCWAHPVVIAGRLYLREKDVVWCYDVRAK